jgi:NAD(P)-dependent dehydrogenase (short-subunit alcohol dehydrogenase family)
MLPTQLAVDLMGPGGAIVNIASTAGLGHGAHGARDYVVARAGVIRWPAASLPHDLRAHGLPQVCNVLPAAGLR